MAILNSWQRIDRVITGLPWGDGATGSATISSDPNTRATFTGTATNTTGTAGDSGIATGSLVMIHQTRGTGAGQWEINKVTSGGSTSLTFQTALQYTYVSGAQIIVIPRYTSATVNSHTITDWDGTKGGIEVIAANTSITVGSSQTVTGTGANGSVANPANTGGAARRGFGGGNGVTNTSAGAQGEGTGGAGGSFSVSANGNGGGGAENSSQKAGSGGGNGTAGTSGGASSVGGAAVGANDGVLFSLGGGGGGSRDEVSFGGGGGSGGKTIVLIGKAFTETGNITLTGGNGGGSGAKGGGGAGGTCLVVCETATLGTNLIVSTGGTGGGAGGVGTIAVHHSGSVTGTTNPTFTDVTDSTLIEATAAAALNRFYFM